MPPCRVRELCAERVQTGSNGSLNNSMLDDSATSTLYKSLNDSFQTADGSPMTGASNGKAHATNSTEDVTDGARPVSGPPLPPRASLILERKNSDNQLRDSPLPVLPKRQPKKVIPVIGLNGCM